MNAAGRGVSGSKSCGLGAAVSCVCSVAGVARSCELRRPPKTIFMLNALLLLLLFFVVSWLTCLGRPGRIFFHRSFPADAAGSDVPPALLVFKFTDSMRGVAILLVLLCHVSGTMGTVVFTPCGGIGVALFLFLSGYGLNESFKRAGLRHYWRKKVARVLFPYFVVISLIYLFEGRDFFSLQYVLEILGLKTSYWYIAFLVKWYVAYWLASRFLPRYRGVFMAVLAVFILFFFPEIEAEQAFSFVAGYWASAHVAWLRRQPVRRLAAWGAAAFAVGTLFLAVKQLPAVRAYEATCAYNLVQLGIKLPFAVAVMAATAVVPAVVRSRFLLFAGALSYELYLLQMPFYARLDGSLLQALIFCAVCFVAALLLNRIDRKVARLIR